MPFAYLRPQEYGNRTDTQWLQVQGSNGQSLRVEGAPDFNFSVHPCALSDLMLCRVPHELPQRTETCLYLDYRHAGLGSERCGPRPLPQYLLPATPTRFGMTLTRVCHFAEVFRGFQRRCRR